MIRPERCPDTPADLYAQSDLSFSWEQDGERKTVRHNDPVFVMGVDGTYLGIGRFLGNTPEDFLGDPDCMPLVEVQGHRVFGYECWWGLSEEFPEEERPQVTPIEQYLAEQEAEDVMRASADRLAQEEMGIVYDETI